VQRGVTVIVSRRPWLYSDIPGDDLATGGRVQPANMRGSCANPEKPWQPSAYRVAHERLHAG
jgi:hypothetical protein